VSNRSIALVVMIWMSILVIWAVLSLNSHLNKTQSIGGAVGIVGSPAGGFVVNQHVTAVPMTNNEVWIINQNFQTVQVVTRDNDGNFHWSSPK
jgi:hypothetical protein